MKCEYVKDPCFMAGLKICNEKAKMCKRRKLLQRGMTQEQIDDLWRVPEKYRVVRK